MRKYSGTILAVVGLAAAYAGLMFLLSANKLKEECKGTWGSDCGERCIRLACTELCNNGERWACDEVGMKHPDERSTDVPHKKAAKPTPHQKTAKPAPHQKTASPPPLIPKAWRGSYKALEKDAWGKNRILSLTATGISVKAYLSGAVTITQGQLDGDTSYIIRAATYSGDKADGDQCTGSMEWTENSISIAMTGSAGKGCSEIISGSFTRQAEGKAP